MPAPIAASAVPAGLSMSGALKSAPGTLVSPSKRAATITLSDQLPILRQLITAPLAPTSSPPPPAVPIPTQQQTTPAKGAAAIAAAAATAAPQSPTAPAPPTTYPYSFTLPYYPSPSHLLSRFVLSRLDDDAPSAAPGAKPAAKPDAKRSKAATGSALPALPAEVVDPVVALTLRCPAGTACMVSVYEYDEWQHCVAPTQTLLSVAEGVEGDWMRVERRVVGEGDVVVDGLALVRERPLLVEAYLDPFHLSPELQVFHTQQHLKRTSLPTPPASLLSTTTSLPAPSPSSKATTTAAKKPNQPAVAAATDSARKPGGAAGPAGDVEDVVRDSWGVVLDVVGRSSGGVVVGLDVTSDEKRRERRAEREKAEPGRARRARAARERWLDEDKWSKEAPEEESKEQMLVEQWPEHKDQATVVSREERQAEKERRAAEAEEAQTFRSVLGELRRIQAAVEDEGDKEEEKRWKEWRERETEAMLREKAERAQLRGQQQQEESDMQAVRAIIAGRAQEREAERERKAADANTQRSESSKPDKPAAKTPAAKGAKDAKAAKADTAITPRQEQSRVDRRREYVARLEAAVQALLAVDSSRQWKVRELVEQVRAEERREAREECELCVAAADSALAQGEVDEAEEKADEEPVSQRKDGKGGKTASKDPKAEKADKERKEVEKKAKDERDRRLKDSKAASIAALNEALRFSDEVGSLAGSSEHDAMRASAKQRGQEKVRDEVNELMGRMDKAEQVENEERDRLKAVSTVLSPTSAGRTSTVQTSRPSSASLQPPPSARRPAATAGAAPAPPAASTAAGGESDLAGLLAAGYGGVLSRLQALALFVESLLGSLDGGDEASAQVRVACEARLGELRRRWEAELRTRQEEEAKAAAASAPTTAAKGKGKGK